MIFNTFPQTQNGSLPDERDAQAHVSGFDAHATNWSEILPGLPVISHLFGKNRKCPAYKASHPSRLSVAYVT
jgi:hypothetical protein